MYRVTLNFVEPLATVARSVPATDAPPPAEPAPEPEMPPVATVEPSELSPDPAAAEAIRAVIAALASVVAELREQCQRTIAETSELSVELGMAIAERLIGVNIIADRQQLDGLVRSSLERMPQARSVIVRAHPDDIALLEQQMQGAADHQWLHGTLRLRSEPSLPRGTMKLEADDWFIHWDTQRCLTELRDALLEEVMAEE